MLTSIWQKPIFWERREASRLYTGRWMLKKSRLFTDVRPEKVMLSAMMRAGAGDAPELAEAIILPLRS